MTVVECSRCGRTIEPDEPLVFINTGTLASMMESLVEQFGVAPRWHWRCLPKALRQYAAPVIMRRKEDACDDGDGYSGSSPFTSPRTSPGGS